MEIDVKQDGEYTTYRFEANNTSYDVVTRDHREFSVWSKRKNCGFDTQLTVYWSLDEMAGRSKTFRNLVALIKAEQETKQ